LPTAAERHRKKYATSTKVLHDAKGAGRVPRPPAAESKLSAAQAQGKYEGAGLGGQKVKSKTAALPDEGTMGG